MEIALAEKKDATDIAEIHKQEISKGFLSSLPEAFLEKLYAAIIENDFCVAAKESGFVVGFIAGSCNVKNFYRYFYKKYFFQAAFLLLPKIFSISAVKKIIENLLYPKKEEGLLEAELLTVAVKKNFQGKGVAQQMLKLFVAEMKNRKVPAFKVVVGEELAPAINFYEKNGFKFLKETEVHKGQKSRIYIYELQ